MTVVPGRSTTELSRLARKAVVGVWLSRHVDGRSSRLPVVGNLRSRIIRAEGGRLLVAGRLRLGDTTTYAGFVARGMPITVEIGRGATVRIEGDVALGDGTRVLVAPGAELVIGDGTLFDGDCRVICGTRTTIGRGCAIGWEVTLMDINFRSIDGAPPDAPVTIGDGVWIGAGARIMAGVHVGDGAIVASGSVVTRDVAPATLVGGVPARVLRHDVTWA